MSGKAWLSLILLGLCAIAMAGWIAVADGLIDRNGKPLGTDFSNVYAAGSLTWQGHPAEAYQPARQHAAVEFKASALATGSLLATPYVLDYDLVVLAVGIAFLARHGLSRGFRPFEISLLAAAWIVPLLSRGIAGVTGVPLGLLLLLTFYAFTLRRAVMDRAGLPAGALGIAQA